MQKVFSQTFDAVKIGEECKQKLKDTLAEYQKNTNASKIIKEKRKFQWSTRRIAIAASTAAVLIFCAIFIPLMAYNGENSGTDMTATYKVELLAAVSQLKVVDSYVENIETISYADGKEVSVDYTTSYQKSFNGYVAEGYMESSDGTNQIYYVVDGYMYMPMAESQFGGVKIRLQGEFVSFVQFFSKNLGYLTPQTINGLDKESNIKKLDSEEVVYSFNAKETTDTFTRNSDYTVKVNSTQRITEIKQTCSLILNGRATNSVMTAKYSYVGVMINLPNNLEAYIEYNG